MLGGSRSGVPVRVTSRRSSETVDEQSGASKRSGLFITGHVVEDVMSVSRTQCGHCGFAVVAAAECPLCEHDLEADDGSSNVQ